MSNTISHNPLGVCPSKPSSSSRGYQHTSLSFLQNLNDMYHSQGLASCTRSNSCSANKTPFLIPHIPQQRPLQGGKFLLVPLGHPCEARVPRLVICLNVPLHQLPVRSQINHRRKDPEDAAALGMERIAWSSVLATHSGGDTVAVPPPSSVVASSSTVAAPAATALAVPPPDILPQRRLFVSTLTIAAANLFGRWP